MKTYDAGILLLLLDSEQLSQKHLLLELSEVSWVSFGQRGRTHGLLFLGNPQESLKP